MHCYFPLPNISFFIVEGGEDEDGYSGYSGGLSHDGSFLVTSDASQDSFLHLSGMDEDPSLYPVPRELELRAGTQPLEYALWAKVGLSRGKRFGPIPAQLKDSECPSPSIWKVSVLK